ncbi:outer membrane beta-barrel protein [Fibrobacter succinogenes]|uniref:outer membrane beta-barrel protein n=1 Tax=Fibrobacter succinogenes TaxID=833 RepID=UPI0013D32E4F|nr:outer membrane beta-barrel protein [Fibrobacter succinogenes]
MNRKITGILSVLALSAFTFAQEPAAATAAPAASAPAAAPAEEAAPVAVRGADAAAPAAAPAEQAAPAAVAATPVAPAEEPVAEPAVVVAPKAVRGADDADKTAASAKAVEQFRDARNTVYYETVYTREDGVPVRTVYVAEREGKDTVTLDELRGLYPMKFKIGARGSVGAYQLAGNDWDSDQYNGISWRAGLMSIIPLNTYTMGIKLGVLYEQSKASESYYINEVPTNFRFSQKKIDVPVLFTFKSATSRIFFDLGVEMSVPLTDDLRVSYTDSNDKKHSNKIDLMDEYRSSLDCAFVFGFSVLANEYLSLDIVANLGVSDLYDGHLKYMNMNLDASSLNLGITVYPF